MTPVTDRKARRRPAAAPPARGARDADLVAAGPPAPEPSVAPGTPHAGFRLPSAGTLAALGAIAAVTAWSYRPVLSWLWRTWSTDPDYSHGFLVPLFSVALLWLRRERGRGTGRVSPPAFAAGLAMLAAGAAAQAAGIYTRTISLEAASLLPVIAGVVLCGGGWAGGRVAWPAVLFLVFMFPIPGAFAGALSGALQRTATVASTFLLQLMGLPAVSEGNIIWLSDASIGVAEACSGIRMLVSFFALTVGACLVMRRPLWEKVVVVASAPLIAVGANVMRISATGVAYDFGNRALADRIFHDLAGWLMMPLGLAMLFAELAVLSRVFLPEEPRGLGGLGLGPAGLPDGAGPGGVGRAR